MEPRGELSAEARVLFHALEKLRARDGITVARLGVNREQLATPLLNLRSVRAHAAARGVPAPEAALEVVRRCVSEHIQGTDLLVSDVILGLGILGSRLRDAGVEARLLGNLQSAVVTSRRRALLSGWRDLQGALGLPASEAPSDRQLRGSVEPAILDRLAGLLIRLEPDDDDQGQPSPVLESGGGPRVIVVGGVVMDVTFGTPAIPRAATSVEAFGFRMAPGGKGFHQAIASARLGLDVSLVAAVGDDEYGQRIIKELRDEGVDTSLLKVVPGTTSPFTGIFELHGGESAAVNWRNDQALRLTADDIAAISADISASEAVLLTFEVPQDTMRRTLHAIHTSPDPRPMVIVTPGQPYPHSGLPAAVLEQMDYLVAHRWELESYTSESDDASDEKAVARRLYALGVQTICLLDGGACSLYTERLDLLISPRVPISYKESSVARDAFCAALAARLAESSRTVTREVAVWATAAMAAATYNYSVPKAMPDTQRVEMFLERNRFAVQDGGGWAAEATRP